MIYSVRVYYLQGWYIVTYALGIYYLNLMIAFLSPLGDPNEGVSHPFAQTIAIDVPFPSHTPNHTFTLYLESIPPLSSLPPSLSIPLCLSHTNHTHSLTHSNSLPFLPSLSYPDKEFLSVSQRGEPSELPTSEQDAAEFKPFVRRLPEFKCWHSVTRGLFTAWLATFFSVFNIPVFWPILVLYFLALLIMTLRRQIGTTLPTFQLSSSQTEPLTFPTTCFPTHSALAFRQEPALLVAEIAIISANRLHAQST